MLQILLLVALSLINMFAVTIYAMTAFGNAMLFHLGWRICTLLDTRVCSDQISLALLVIYISCASVFLFPIQVWLRRQFINWPLAFHLIASQQAGLYLGVYIAFTFKSVYRRRAECIQGGSRSGGN
jgi:hypothetical protein